MRGNLEDVDFFLIDEYSMLGCKALHQIDQRLRQIKKKESLFGEASVILLGDLH